jgi:exopolyphosphatase/guanosine-5'-triphosphate,3'-diphosphate pyrophosphatase
MAERPRRTRTALHGAASRRLPAPLAVIDIGSNSGRITVMRLHRSGHLEVLADARAPLRLARDVGPKAELSEAALRRTLAALHDFRAIALGAGATSILAVATSAVREAKNATELVRRARGLGIKLVVIDGQREATFAFLGAVHGLPVDHGLLLDLGGGSLEISRFRNRRLLCTWTLPLGALRVSDLYLKSDPPTASQVERLRSHVRKSLRKAGVPPLAADERLIGTGGTIRNIAKMEARAHREALPRVHGYTLERARMRTVSRQAGRLRQARRATIPGLNRDRADSIVGGLLVMSTAMEFLQATSMQVSGQGLREGIALATLGQSPPPALAVRQASVEALARRFVTFRRDIARRRVRIAARLLVITWPKAPAEIREILAHVCLLLDIGRSVDYYDRHRNAAVIIAAADLQGFTPRGVALAFAVLMHADNAANRLKTLRPALRPKDGVLVERAAVLLLLADEIERRSLPGQPLAVRAVWRDEGLVLKSEVLAGWRPRAVGDRFRRAFGRELRVTGD